MRSMASAKPARVCPPSGTYPFNINAASAGQTKIKNQGQPNQKGGDSCIELGMELAEGPFAGFPLFDTLGTDGGTDFGSMSKKKWRQLGVNVDTDAEVPDEVIAQGLLNRRIFVNVEQKPIEKLNTVTNKWEPEYEIDEKTGIKVARLKLQVVGYVQQPVAGQQATQGQLAPAPQQQLQQPPAQYAQAPVGQPGLPQGMPPAQGLPQGFPQAGAPAGFPPAPQFAPPGFAPAAPGGFPQVSAPPGWVPQNGVQGAPQGVPGQQPFPGMPGAPGAPR